MSRRTPNLRIVDGQRVVSAAVSLVIHGLAVVLIVAVARSVVKHAPTDEERAIATFHVPPPPPPPPVASPPPAPVEPRIEKPKVDHIVIPTVIPDVAIPQPTAPEVAETEPPEGPIGGGVGGAEGGVLGGTIGGVLGGAMGGELDPEQPRVLTDDITPPELIERVEPEYPSIAARARRSGEVILECVIRADGSVEVEKVLREIPLLTESAIAAVKKWKYKPAIYQGRPMAVYLTVRVRFSLN